MPDGVTRYGKIAALSLDGQITLEARQRGSSAPSLTDLGSGCSGFRPTVEAAPLA
jgi:hypothetical protein